MTSFVTVARVDEVEPGTARQVWVRGEPLAVFNLDGEFYATSDICTHEEYYLHGGIIAGNEVECPMHGAVFDVTTGEVMEPPAEYPLATFPCRVVEGDIQIGVAL